MSYRIRRCNNSLLRGSNLKFAYAHNLTISELQNITNNYQDLKKNDDNKPNQQTKNMKHAIQQNDQLAGMPDTNVLNKMLFNIILMIYLIKQVFIKAKLVAKEEKMFDMIRNAQHNQLKLFDSQKYVECEADGIFSNRNKNNEIYDKLQHKVMECLEKKKNYTFLLLGTPNTGKNNILLNKYLLDCYGNPQLTNQIRDQQGGVIQRALNDICSYLKGTNQEDKEVMISIIGFHQDRVIDLLNLDQNLESIQKDNLKIKTEENMGISVEDLIQMSIWSFSEFVSVYRIYTFMKKILKEQIGMNIKTIVIQISVAKVSKQKDFIEKIEQKFTFVKMTNCAQNLENMSNLGFCMDNLKKSNNSVPYRQKKLTFFLKDSLNANSHITLFQTVTNQESLKSQLSTVQLTQSFNKKMLLKKNYLYDKEFLEYLQKEDNGQNKLLFASEQETSVNSSIHNNLNRKQKTISIEFKPMLYYSLFRSDNFKFLLVNLQIFVEYLVIFQKKTNRETQSKNDMKKYIVKYQDQNLIDFNTSDPNYHIRAETFSSQVKKRDRCTSIPTKQKIRLDKIDKTSLSPKNQNMPEEFKFIPQSKLNESSFESKQISSTFSKKTKSVRERIAGIYDLTPAHREEIIGKSNKNQQQLQQHQ